MNFFEEIEKYFIFWIFIAIFYFILSSFIAKEFCVFLNIEELTLSKSGIPFDLAFTIVITIILLVLSLCFIKLVRFILNVVIKEQETIQ